MSEGQPPVNPAPPVPRRALVVSLVLLAALVGVVAVGWLRWPARNAPAAPPANVRASPKGWKVRYNANISLAVKGSDKVRLGLLREMLDEDQQLKNFEVTQKNGRVVSDEAGARQAIANTLRALVAWRKQLDPAKAYGPDNEELKEVYAAVRKLAKDSPSLALRKEALRAEQALHLD